ncbi:MAG TPA: glucokinase [Blastocatellia bacterium]|nr:glucokinase [Blastocatellia bacterium]
MILAGDIGGTKTNLGLFDIVDGAMTLRCEQSYASRNYPGLESIIDEFTSGVGVVTAACVGVAGPVIEGRSTTTNLPWLVDSQPLASLLKLNSVALINDLEATAHGIAELKPSEFVTLNEGTAEPGNAALIAAGTGLGAASLFWDGLELMPSASEGGHVDFAPRNQLEIQLLKDQLTKHQHVSVERVLSGPGLFVIYEFLRDINYANETSAIAGRFKDSDPSSVVANAALAGECELCVKALDMFAGIYGAVAGNIALQLKATAGVYVGGGIAPKIIEKLKDGTFMKAFTDKGRLSPLLEAISVRVIMNDKTALLGAARVAAKLI